MTLPRQCTRLPLVTLTSPRLPARFVGAPLRAQVLAEDLRGCLRWGLAEGQGCLLRLLRLDAFPLAAGNPAVVEMAASLCMPEQLASLCAALGTGGARLFFAPAVSAAASALSVVRQSYAWDGHAQGVMWQLLLAELPARGLPVAEDLASQVHHNTPQRDSTAPAALPPPLQCLTPPSPPPPPLPRWKSSGVAATQSLNAHHDHSHFSPHRSLTHCL